MNIYFYLDNEEETSISVFHDLISNPFKIGDEILLKVEELYPIEYNKIFDEELQSIVIANNKKLGDMFERKKIKIVREGKYVSLKITEKPKLTIEYHCVFL